MTMLNKSGKIKEQCETSKQILVEKVNTFGIIKEIFNTQYYIFKCIPKQSTIFFALSSHLISSQSVVSCALYVCV